MDNYTFVICGDQFVGKKTFVKSVLERNPQLFIVDDVPCSITVYISSSFDKYHNQSLFSKADAFIIIYSVDSLISQTMVTYYYDEIITHFKKTKLEIPILLIGNKKDIPNKDRKIFTEEGEEMGLNFGIPFMEISAKFGKNANLYPFYYLIRVLRGTNVPIKTKKRKATCTIM